MREINCHSSTPIADIEKFVIENIGSKIELHYEYNIINSWGDDEIEVFDTNNSIELVRLNKLIKENYIHNIKSL